MKKSILFSALLTLSACVSISACGEKKVEPVRDDGLYRPFVITGAQLLPEALDNNVYCTSDKLFALDYADSECNIYFMHDGAIVSCQVNTIKDLFPNVDKFELNGKTVSKSEFYATPASTLLLVEYSDGVLRAKTDEDVNANNPYYTEESEAESAFWQSMQTGTLPSGIVLGDPTTLPADGLVIDGLMMRSPKSVAGKKFDKVALYRYGNRVVMTFNGQYDPKPQANGVELPVSSLKSLAVDDILAATNTSPDDVFSITLTNNMVSLIRVSDIPTAEK